jgi:hypothetical protein
MPPMTRDLVQDFDATSVEPFALAVRTGARGTPRATYALGADSVAVLTVAADAELVALKPIGGKYGAGHSGDSYAWDPDTRRIVPITPLDAMLHAAESRLAYFASLGPDWDSYGGDPPTRRAIESARHLLEAVCAQFATAPLDRVRPFAITPTPNGGVIIEWRSPGLETAIEIGRQGSLGYLVVEGTNEPYRYLEDDLVSMEKVLELISRAIRG